MHHRGKFHHCADFTRVQIIEHQGNVVIRIDPHFADLTRCFQAQRDRLGRISLLHPNNDPSKVIDRPDSRRRLDVANEALTGDRIGCAKRGKALPLRRDRRARCHAIEHASREAFEYAVEIGSTVRDKPPSEAKFRGDALHKLDIEAAWLAIHEVERRIGKGGSNAKLTGNNCREAHDAFSKRDITSIKYMGPAGKRQGKTRLERSPTLGEPTFPPPTAPLKTQAPQQRSAPGYDPVHRNIVGLRTNGRQEANRIPNGGAVTALCVQKLPLLFEPAKEQHDLV